MGGIESIPDGIFNTLLDLWATIRASYVLLLEFLTSQVVNIPGYEGVSVVSVFLGTGIFLYIIYTLIKWIIPV